MKQDQKRVDQIREFGSRITSAKAKADDANMGVASIYKAVDDSGLNKKAMKQAVAFRKMEAADFAVHWLELKDYCEAFGLFDQPDLFLDGNAEVVTVRSAPAAPATDKVTVVEPVKEKPKAEKANAAKAPADDFGVVGAREAGKRAGLADKGRDQNPNPEGSMDAQMWDAGWTEGHQELVDKAALANGANTRPRRQRGALTEEGDVTVPPSAAAASLVSAELAGLPN